MKLQATSLLAVALLVVVPLSALLACNAVLGIDSNRKLDTSYPDGGYEGCSEKTGCKQCSTELQRCLCEGGDMASCEGTQPKLDCESLDDDCMTCVCLDCSEHYANCTASAGCRRIRSCAADHGCDLDSSSAQSCESSSGCGDVIDANGGPAGLPRKLFDTLANCSIQADCPCNGRGCTEQFGCEGCSDCISSCKCQGQDETECQSQCAAPCSNDDDCEGCEDCMSECTCRGQSESECQDQCKAEQCSSGEDCGACSDCFSKCVCEGSSESDCADQCSIIACPETDCVGLCICEGSSESDCQELCAVAACSKDDNCMSCSDCVSECVCRGQTESECQDKCSCLLEYDGCSGCADCMAECQCNGDTSSDCELSCGTVSTCSPESGCADCSTCFEECRCNEGTVAFCTRDCGITRNENCSPGVSCSDCGTCVTSCTCDGGDPSSCMDKCGLTACPADCDSCVSCMDRCECNGSAVGTCLGSCVGSACASLGLSACDDCSCNNCPELFGRCWEDVGCQEIAQCMEDTGCLGISCFTVDYCSNVADVWGGVSGVSAALAEELVMCRDLSACDCAATVTPPVKTD